MWSACVTWNLQFLCYIIKKSYLNLYLIQAILDTYLAHVYVPYSYIYFFFLTMHQV